MKQITMKKGLLYANGSSIKPLANRKVTVLEYSKPETVYIEFKRMADSEEVNINKSPAYYQAHKGKLLISSFTLSEQAALALYCCLGDYFDRVKGGGESPFNPVTDVA